MSRVAKKPIELPKGVEFKIDSGTATRLQDCGFLPPIETGELGKSHRAWVEGQRFAHPLPP